MGWRIRDGEAALEARLELAKRGLNPEGWNVRLNGKLVAECVTREDAEIHMKVYRTRPHVGECIQVYRADRPIEKRPTPRGNYGLPRPWSGRVTPKEREKAIANVKADKEILCEEET